MSGANVPPDAPPAQTTRAARPQGAASIVRFKAALRKAVRRNAREPEIDFLNITAMLDMMTIILVFLLKSMSQSSASLPQSGDLTMPKSVLTTEASQEGVAVLISLRTLEVSCDSFSVLSPQPWFSSSISP